jgi:hypothetical protein
MADQAAQTNQVPQPAAPSLVIVFLDQKSNTFKVATDQTLKLQKTGDGQTSLGYVEARPKTTAGPEGKPIPIIGENNQPALEMVFVPLINYPVEIVAAAQAPKVELATKIPDALKKTSKVGKNKKALN